MTTNKKEKEESAKSIEPKLTEELWKKSWTYIKTVVDVVREPVLILNSDLRVMAANESFFRTFQVELKDTHNKHVYELGDGQWNIPALKKLLEDILPKNTFFKGFEVVHEFPFIGRKTMILNARQIHFKEDTTLETFPPIILLAMEDVTEIMLVAETLASHANQTEVNLTKQTHKLEIQILKLKKEVTQLKKTYKTHKK